MATHGKIIKEVELYKGEVILRKCEGRWGHEYWVSDAATNKGSKPEFEKKTGVTTIIGIKDKSRPLVIWATELAERFLLDVKGKITPEHIRQACKLHTEKKEAAANIGTKVHSWIEEYIAGKKPEMPEDDSVSKGVIAFLSWMEENKVKFTASEEIIYSRKYGYCGSLDFEAKVNGKTYLGDFKTSNALRNDVLMQTAAYAMARTEESGIEFDGRYLLRLSKETEEEHAERTKDKNQAYVEPYKVFEAIPVMEEIKNDFKAFLAFQVGYFWNKESEKRLKLLKNI